MKKFVLSLLAVLMSTSAVYAGSVFDVRADNHICRQLGTSICGKADCTVWGSQRHIVNKSCTASKQATQTTTQNSTQTTTQNSAQTVTQTTTQTTTEAATETTTSAATGTYAQQVLSLVNEERAKEGLSPLTLSSSVSSVAQAKAEDMKANSYFSHTSPTYGSPFDMLKSFGISYSTAGENIAKGQKTPQAVVSAWMNSSGHRANILNENYTQMGIGYVGGSSPYWVQMFIGKH